LKKRGRKGGRGEGQPCSSKRIRTWNQGEKMKGGTTTVLVVVVGGGGGGGGGQ
jgi:hypothetical protein